jgi:hypothetical protein
MKAPGGLGKGLGAPASVPVKPAVPVKVSVPIKPKVDGRTKLIGNLGAFAHPPKGKKK